MRVRKRVITLGLCLGLGVSQFMIHMNNKVFANNENYNNYQQNITNNKENYYPGLMPKEDKLQLETNTISIPQNNTIINLEMEIGEESSSINTPEINTKTNYDKRLNSDIKKETINSSNKNCPYTIGINVMKEPYNKKILITEVVRNSPAARAGLQIGDEILKVNGKKARKGNIHNFINMINKSGNSVDLYIRDVSNSKYHLKVNKSTVCFPEKRIDENFNMYWLQIGPDVEPIPQILYQRISIRAKNYDLPILNKWLERKKRFRFAYNSCRHSATTSTMLQNCMSGVINQHLTEIELEQKRAHQMNMMRMGVQAVSGLSYALMNQHVNHSGTVNVNQNVHYSGGYNVNHKIDHNIRHNVYWHNW